MTPMTEQYKAAKAANFLDPYLNYIASRHDPRNCSKYRGIRIGIVPANLVLWENDHWDPIGEEGSSLFYRRDGYTLNWCDGDIWVFDSPYVLKCNWAFIGTAPGAGQLNDWKQEGALLTVYAMALGPEWFETDDLWQPPYPMERLVRVEDAIAEAKRDARRG
jgi:hypothetical protein